MAGQRAGRAPRRGARLPLYLALALVALLGAMVGLVGILAPETPRRLTPTSVSLTLERPSSAMARPEAAPSPPAKDAPAPVGAETAPAATTPAEREPSGPKLDNTQFAALPPGDRPVVAYARPFDMSDPRPRIAVILTGLGLSSAATDTAIKRLPGSITLAFMPYADNLNGWVRLARASGHEVLLSLPMEPVNYPVFDPGPKALLTSLTTQQNLARLGWTLQRTSGYVGVVGFMGSHFTTSERHLKPVLAAVNGRGLLFVDNGAALRSAAGDVARAIGLPFVESTQRLDENASRASIDARLRDLEQIAKRNGWSVGIGSLYPITLERISAWAPSVERRGLALAPVSAVAAMTRKGSDG